MMKSYIWIYHLLLLLLCLGLFIHTTWALDFDDMFRTEPPGDSTHDGSPGGSNPGGSTQQDVWSELERLKRPDDGCINCTHRSQKLITCSDVFLIEACPDIYTSGGDASALPVALDEKDFHVNFADVTENSANMIVQWKPGYGGLPALEGFYMKVTSHKFSFDSTPHCVLFDLRTANLTIQKIKPSTFEYSCFPAGFVEPGIAYTIRIETIPSNSQPLSNDIIVPTTSTSPAPTTTPVPTTLPPTTSTLPPTTLTLPPTTSPQSRSSPSLPVKNWQPEIVHVQSPSQIDGDIEVLFSPANPSFGVIAYHITLLAPNNQTLTDTNDAAANVKDAGSGLMSATFHLQCSEAMSLPAGVTIQASHVGDNGKCLCELDDVDSTAPCQQRCPVHYSTCIINKRDVCGEREAALSAGIIAGIVIASFVVIAGLVFVGRVCNRTRKSVLVRYDGQESNEDVLQMMVLLRKLLRRYLPSTVKIKLDANESTTDDLTLAIPPVDGRNAMNYSTDKLTIHLDGCDLPEIQDGSEVFKIPDELPALINFILDQPRCFRHVLSIKPQKSMEWSQLQCQIAKCRASICSDSGIGTEQARTLRTDQNIDSCSNYGSDTRTVAEYITLAGYDV